MRRYVAFFNTRKRLRGIFPARYNNADLQQEEGSTTYRFAGADFHADEPARTAFSAL
jgi:hypothetical protein